jgi:hypothetical protein
MDESPLLHPMSHQTFVHRGKIGVVAGIVAGIPMGLLLHLGTLHTGTDFMSWLGLLLGESSAIRGWLVHLFTSGVFGFAFAVFASLRLFEELGTSVFENAILGVIHASVLATVMIGVVLPVISPILVSRGTAAGDLFAPTAGGLGASVVLALAHLVWGIVLGAIYGFYHESLE